MNSQDVLEFRRKLRLPVGAVPQLLPAKQTSFYARFMMEELSEFLSAHEREDLVDAADALGDLIYIALGAGLHMGLPMDGILEEIHKANMAKQPGMTKRGIEQDAVKPAEWVGPEAGIKELIARAWDEAVKELK